MTELEKDIQKLVAVHASMPTELTACFLGNSGVGKSTLINALVGGSTILLPAGGIGPLTAQALTVRYGDEPRFEVRYHPFQNLWRMIFGLEKSHRAELAPIATVADDPPEPVDSSDESSEEETCPLPDTESTTDGAKA